MNENKIFTCVGCGKTFEGEPAIIKGKKLCQGCAMDELSKDKKPTNK